jgi:hypothetical protein
MKAEKIRLQEVGTQIKRENVVKYSNSFLSYLILILSAFKVCIKLGFSQFCYRLTAVKIFL